jgi:hypothetical protein
MNMTGALHWAEAHPTESILIGGAGVIALLWLFGAFKSSGSSADAGASSLASAYYAAEAQQAVVGGQIQVAGINATAATAQTKLQADAASAINASNNNAAIITNGQNASVASHVADTGLLATYSNNDTAYKTAQSNNDTQAAINANNNATFAFSDLMHLTVPAEFARLGAESFHIYTPWGQDLGVTGGSASPGTPFAYEQAGYSADAAQKMAAAYAAIHGG